MKPSISVITLAVDDLERAYRFYHEGLGLASEGIDGSEYEHGAVAFFDLQAGLKLALWPRASLAADSGLALDRTLASPLLSPLASLSISAASDTLIAHNVASAGEVDTLMAQAAAAGATIVKPAQTTFWGGYAAYFMDPDRHLWEVVWNPKWALPA